MGFDAMTDHRAILIDGLVYLPPEPATGLRWATAIVGAVGAGLGLMALGVALFGAQCLIVGDEAIELPKSLFSAERANIPYRTVGAVNLITVGDHRFLKLSTAKRSFTIADGKLSDPEAFETIRRAIAAGMAAEPSAPRPTPAAPPPPAPSRPAAPTAPRPFGRRT